MADPTPTPNEVEYANFVPAPVRRAAERANELARLANGNETVDEPATTLAAQVAGDGAPSGATVVEPTLTPAPMPTPTTPAPAPAPVDWEQRYRTLQGKYDHEVPSLRGEMGRLTALTATLGEQIDALKQPAPVPATVSDADVETYGEDLVTAARRWARAEVASELADLNRKFQQLEATTHTVQQETAQTRAQAQQQGILAALDADPAIGASWRVTNDSPDFLAWLDQVDPFTGSQRMALLRDAYGRGDAVRTAAFFKAYHNEHTATQVQPVAQPTPPAGTGQPTLADFAAPGRTTGQAPGGAPADKRIWTQRDITAFYDDKRRGRFQNREADAARMEQDLILAASEGRIR